MESLLQPCQISPPLVHLQLQGSRHHLYPKLLVYHEQRGEGKAMAAESDPVIRTCIWSRLLSIPCKSNLSHLFIFLIYLPVSGCFSWCRQSCTSILCIYTHWLLHLVQRFSHYQLFQKVVLIVCQRQCPIPAKQSDLQSLCCKGFKFHKATIIWTHSDIFHFVPQVFWPSIGNLASQTEIYMGHGTTLITVEAPTI